MTIMNLLSAIFLCALPVARAYTWVVTPAPRQCDTVNLRVSGNDARTPYQALVIPYGPMPLVNAAYRVYEIPFNGKDWYMVDFQIKYPVGTQFSVVVSDARGMWPGGSILPSTVLSSYTDDNSCLDTSPPKSLFSFSLYPNRLSQCEETRIYWNADDVHGTPFFLALVPDQGWAVINVDTIDDRPGFGRGFTWRVPFLAGKTVAIVAGDLRGNASGGVIVTTVQYGTSFDSIGNCPVVGATGTISYPLVTQTISYTGHKIFLNVGTVIGVVIGLVVCFIALVIGWVIVRRRRRHLARGIKVPQAVPVFTEEKQNASNMQEQVPSAGSGGRNTFHLPEIMSSPGPTMMSVPNVSQGVWPPAVSSQSFDATVPVTPQGPIFQPGSHAVQLQQD